jgi:UDP-N-acetylmuramoyl-tripeptide--D-alanyl-D-alanine ligase
MILGVPHLPWTAQRLADAAGGALVAGTGATVLRGTVCVDTRLLAPGDAFLGLPGEHTDGGLHVEDAVRRGAAAVIAAPAHLRSPPAGVPAIAVEDPHTALRRCARARREALGPAVDAVGVTGAAGKTTTTDILATLMRTRGPVHATRHGFNTGTGVALTVAAAPPDVRSLVVEVAMHGAGHIAASCEVLLPTAGVITNIGPEHLATAGTVRDVAAHKAELLAALPPGAPCVVPAGEPLLEPYLRADLRTITHGPHGDVRLLSLAEGIAEIDCAGERVTLELSFDQPHRVRNLVAAVAMAWALGVPPDGRPDIVFSPLRWQPARLGEVELVLDCAKTSPLALRAALTDFAAEPARRRIAVLGALPELGDESERYHREAGALAQALGIDALVCVGDVARWYLTGYGGEAHVVADAEAARAVISAIGGPGDRVLVKGARRAALQRIVPPAT